MIIHSSAGMAFFTAAYVLAQSIINPGSDIAKHQASKAETPPGIQQARTDAPPIVQDNKPAVRAQTEQARVDVAPVEKSVHKGRKVQVAAAEQARKQQKKVIVIGRNTVSVKYVTR